MRPRPVVMTGRRDADRILTPRVKAAAAGGALAAVLAGFVMHHLLEARVAIAQTAPAAERPAPTQQTPAEAAWVEEERTLTEELLAQARAAKEGRRVLDQGRKLLSQGHVKRAAHELAEAVRLRPDDALAAHIYGITLWKLSSRDRALFHLQRAVRLDPGTPRYRVELARALQATGRTEQALRELEAARGLDPALADAASPGLALAAAGGGPAVAMGGAGSGRFAGRRSFSDRDLATQRPAPLAVEPGTGAPESR